ncbi:MAG TPA: imelysin family protein [Polyangiaceae bacterium]|jgi:predicted lipoprotein|nr:imelysin family protein [Polyangiaceae bacterium]
MNSPIKPSSAQLTLRALARRGEVAAVTLGLACLLLGCDNNTDAPEVSYGALLGNLTDQVIVPEHQQFAMQADALVTAVQALQAAPSTDSLSSAQTAWRAARSSWRLLDALHFGPVITLATTDRIDVSPADPTAIEAIISGTGNVDDAAVGKASAQAKGFLALEYLLFSADPSMPAPVLATDGLATRRLSFAHSLADDLAQAAHLLDNSWEPTGGNYANALKSAGSGSTRYTTQRAAVDDLVNGVSYALELVVGVRLAVPLGRKSGGTPDPTLDPTTRSDSAVADMTASLDGVGAVYAPPGLSNNVRNASASVDQEMTQDLSAAEAAISAIPAPFASAVANDSTSGIVTSAYGVAKTLNDLWNTDITSALGATLKPSDPDGD